MLGVLEGEEGQLCDNERERRKRVLHMRNVVSLF